MVQVLYNTGIFFHLLGQFNNFYLQIQKLTNILKKKLKKKTKKIL